jgi:hypothetical protein
MFLLGSCTPPATVVAGGIISINAKDLYSAYAKDQAAADAQYKGRMLEVTGEVLVSKAVILVDKYYIILDADPEDTANVWGIQCTFDDTRDPALYEVIRHQTATIRGRCDGMEQDVVLGACELVSVGPRPTPVN